MKIIREHHGFTTNSSASSEWVDLAAKYQELARQQAEQHAKKTRKKKPPPKTPMAKRMPKASWQNPCWKKKPTTRSRRWRQRCRMRQCPTIPFMDNLATIGLIAMSILGIFAVERAIRRWMKKRQAVNDDV